MTKRKILTYILIPILSVYLFICNLSIISFADVPSTQKVVTYTGTWDSYGINITGLGKYYVIEDSTGIPVSTYQAPNFFYTKDNVTFDYVRGINLVVNQLNKIVGVIISPERIAAFYTYFFNKIGLLDDNNHAQGGLYDSNNNFLGYCLNDITGCYYVHNTNTKDISVPSYFPNNVKNVVDEDFVDDYPAFVHVYPFISSNVINNIKSSYNFGQTERERFNSVASENDIFVQACYLFTGNEHYFVLHDSNGGWKNLEYSNIAIKGFYNSNGDTNYTGFCSNNNLTTLNNTITVGELNTGNNQKLLRAKPVDADFNDINSFTKYDLTNGSTSNVSYDYYYWEYGVRGNYIVAPMGKDFLIFRDKTTLLSFFDGTYLPKQYVTNNYNNYDISNDNSNTVSTYNLDNSVSYNSSIWSQSSDSYYEYVDNGVVDNSSIINNVTNITNNYYGSSSGEGGEGGGGSDSDGVLDTLLQGLLAFFNAIGRVLATVITGILDMFTTVLDAIANLTTDLTGITDFFGTLFSWMPDPIPQVIGIGFSVCVLAAVIKFIRG